VAEANGEAGGEVGGSDRAVIQCWCVKMSGLGA
jgi:hypothetical protein